MADDRETVEAERRHHHDRIARERPLRLIEHGGARISDAAQIGRDHGEPGNEAGDDLSPTRPGLRETVQQQDRRPGASYRYRQFCAARADVFHLVALQHDCCRDPSD